MSACVSKSFHLTCSPLKIDEDNNIEKQGIITILGSDSQSSKAAASLRRTLSAADMSSKKWQSQNGFNSMKKIASSAQLLSQESNQKLGHDEIWASIQLDKDKQQKNSSLTSSSSVTAWGTIITQEQQDSTNLPPPYIHPLVKRSTSSLSEKSLEICTECLGTETGSDVFASYPTSETGDNQEDEKDDLVVKINIQDASQPQQQLEVDDEEEMHVVKYNYSCTKKLLAPKSFPPPLPSLAQQDGASLQMQSHRENGRLVLEAVSVPTKNYFHVQRQEGRLLLTLLVDNSPPHHDVRIEERNAIVKEYDQVFDVDIDEVERKDEQILDEEEAYDEEEEDEEEEEEENKEFMFEQSKKLPPSSRVITMPKAAFMMNKYMGLRNKNLTWPQSIINKAHVKLMEVEDEEIVVKNELTTLPQSLPPPPRVARLISTGAPPAASSFNAYEYFWREKQSVANIISPIHEDYNTTHLKNNHHNKVILKSNLMGYEQQNLVLMKGDKGDYLVPFMSKCNEPRRSLLFWEPYCIATS